MGLPHSSLCVLSKKLVQVSLKTLSIAKPDNTYHSPHVKGMEASVIVQTTSTNGTPKMATPKSSGAWFMLAPISNPPALRPSQESCDGVVNFLSYTQEIIIGYMKQVNQSLLKHCFYMHIIKKSHISSSPLLTTLLHHKSH